MTCGLLAAISSGATLVLPSIDPVFDPAIALETTAADRITVLEGIPAMYVALLDAAHHYDEDFSTLRVSYRRAGLYQRTCCAALETGLDASSWMQTSGWPRAHLPTSAYPICGEGSCQRYSGGHRWDPQWLAQRQ
jgi:hypothetical protein